MVSVSDIIKLLEKIPVWKRMAAMPERIKALEKRMEAIEKSGGSGSCKGCCKADPLLISQQKAPAPFGNMGAMIEIYRCPACEQETKKHIDPGS